MTDLFQPGTSAVEIPKQPGSAIGALTLVVYETPAGQPKGAPAVSKAGKAFIHHRTTLGKGATRRPHPAVLMRHAVRQAAIEMMEGYEAFDGPVRMTIESIFPRTGSPLKTKPNPRRPKTAKPDYDNISKPVSDACNLIVYVDDSQIYDARFRKIEGEPGEIPRLVIRFEFGFDAADLFPRQVVAGIEPAV